ncbi:MULTISPECIES: type IV pilus modification protein PilV [Stenotrophomonas]|jgi:type IV pilus assembly protein PilV|uniref:Type IV pilus modification protein PilV n=1 Tax=Stenotrophomonas pavanii TaxID=487698 RepID=A0A246KTB2_9GAMM|nr:MULTISPECIES: type IV pilus modification protein PilV [Stenotrophomonas]MBC9081404.1 type IV pilus modification protein PilV [Stenotrophomonas maltophilia]MBC9091650.1 type IV pilus modification protein PilV [Stenotrophomonas maltophilia]MBH1389941.1 type IV pilus modification protein PilV [Stenotrophomonas maltophilia]MBH1521541.1 type IV pilus modification protein PilV [Stenotrophomonas maltophilia]MBN4942994.1 type IV pilus modification protein PilV [Stenotrophomonas maltophilia]
MNRRLPSFARRQGGFSMMEVLVTIIVLAFGLLGFALLQTMNVRFVQSSNYRTQATNLAYDMLDQMRSNRYQAAWYTNATFAANSIKSSSCTRTLGAGLGVASNITRWQCQVVQALGEGASATVLNANGQVTVAIAWGDQRWDASNPDTRTTFTLVSQL